MPRPALSPLFLLVLLLAACARMPPDPTRPASVDASLPPAPSSHPDWLPLHADPRPGDWAIHYRLTAAGLTRTQRRTEVLSLTADRVVLRRTLGDVRGRPLQVLILRVDASGAVHEARLGDSGGPTVALSRGSLARTRLARAEPLELVSGRHAVDHIVVQRGEDGSDTTHYLDRRRPFAELVSLTTRDRLSPTQLNKLLGRIAVVDGDRAASARTTGYGGIRDGWVLMHWGRGSR